MIIGDPLRDYARVVAERDRMIIEPFPVVRYDQLYEKPRADEQQEQQRDEQQRAENEQPSEKIIIANCTELASNRETEEFFTDSSKDELQVQPEQRNLFSVADTSESSDQDEETESTFNCSTKLQEQSDGEERAESKSMSSIPSEERDEKQGKRDGYRRLAKIQRNDDQQIERRNSLPFTKIKTWHEYRDDPGDNWRKKKIEGDQGRAKEET